MRPLKQHRTSLGLPSGLLLACLITSTVQPTGAEGTYEQEVDRSANPSFLAQANGAGDTTQSPPTVADFCYNDDSIGSCTSNCRQFKVLSNGSLIPGSCAQRYYCTQNIDPCQ